jgi:hypothetical protein
MQSSLVRLCPVIVMLATACSAPPPAASSATPSSTTIDGGAVWERYRSAAGKAALGDLRGFRVTGVVVDPADGANRRLQIEAEAPARYRQRETPEGQDGPGIRQLVGYNGTMGWRAGNTMLAGDGLSEDPAVRDRAVTAAGRQNYVNFIAGVSPLWLQEAGLTLTTVGAISDGEDRGAMAVNISKDGADLGRLVFDPSTHLPRRLVVSFLRGIRPEGGEYRIAFSDYRDAGQGVQLPHLISRQQGGMTVQWIISAYQLNPGFPAGTFEPPARR